MLQRYLAVNAEIVLVYVRKYAIMVFNGNSTVMVMVIDNPDFCANSRNLSLLVSIQTS